MFDTINSNLFSPFGVGAVLELDVRATKPNIANAPIIEFLIVSFIVLNFSEL